MTKLSLNVFQRKANTGRFSLSKVANPHRNHAALEIGYKVGAARTRKPSQTQPIRAEDCPDIVVRQKEIACLFEQVFSCVGIKGNPSMLHHHKDHEKEN